MDGLESLVYELAVSKDHLMDFASPLDQIAELVLPPLVLLIQFNAIEGVLVLLARDLDLQKVKLHCRSDLSGARLGAWV